MHILLIGCGRSGRHLAEILTDAGIDLIVIDENENNLQALADLDVICIQGVPIDTDILEQAGIENAAAVIAMDNRENINIMCCQCPHALQNRARYRSNVHAFKRRILSSFGYCNDLLNGIDSSPRS